VISRRARRPKERLSETSARGTIRVHGHETIRQAAVQLMAGSPWVVALVWARLPTSSIASASPALQAGDAAGRNLSSGLADPSRPTPDRRPGCCGGCSCSGGTTPGLRRAVALSRTCASDASPARHRGFRFRRTPRLLEAAAGGHRCGRRGVLARTGTERPTRCASGNPVKDAGSQKTLIYFFAARSSTPRARSRERSRSGLRPDR